MLLALGLARVPRGSPDCAGAEAKQCGDMDGSYPRRKKCSRNEVAQNLLRSTIEIDEKENRGNHRPACHTCIRAESRETPRLATRIAWNKKNCGSRPLPVPLASLDHPPFGGARISPLCLRFVPSLRQWNAESPTATMFTQNRSASVRPALASHSTSAHSAILNCIVSWNPWRNRDLWSTCLMCRKGSRI